MPSRSPYQAALRSTSLTVRMTTWPAMPGMGLLWSLRAAPGKRHGGGGGCCREIIACGCTAVFPGLGATARSERVRPDCCATWIFWSVVDHVNAAPRDGDDEAFVSQDSEGFLGGAFGDPVLLGDGLDRWHWLTRRDLAGGDHLAQDPGKLQVGR